MNVIKRIATNPAVLIAALGLASAPALADHDDGRYSRSGAQYAYATVLSAEPIVRYVTVRTPVQECWTEQREYAVERHGGAAGRTLAGAIIGGVIGHQFGSGSGNDAATVAGALIGAAAGNGAARRHGVDETVYSRPVRRCNTNYTTREEERIDGYRVTYRYHGQKYATRMPHDPGERLRIRVDVRPAE